ncbi:hypothetical protein COR50_19130 [Chitinophaga caeni]|uniref:Uncharacterized protein n=1 Tax=Chitinophaga caeni TaxID=2029983 RepID=A0A291QZ36_9BACT|nr:hypothetical protein [Chitinophaga caeni]ATL49114.1 hypothetical protein COR50_19130 [Chitinophaga caeni]
MIAMQIDSGVMDKIVREEQFNFLSEYRLEDFEQEQEQIMMAILSSPYFTKCTSDERIAAIRFYLGMMERLHNEIEDRKGNGRVI